MGVVAQHKAGVPRCSVAVTSQHPWDRKERATAMAHVEHTGVPPGQGPDRHRPGVCDAGNIARFHQNRSLFCFLYGPRSSGRQGSVMGGAGTHRVSTGLFHTVRARHTRTQMTFARWSPCPQGTEAGKASPSSHPRGQSQTPRHLAQPPPCLPARGTLKASKGNPVPSAGKERRGTVSIASFISI